MWTFQGLTISDSPIGIDVGDQMGSLVLIDSLIRNCPTGIRTGYKPDANTSKNSVLLDRVQASNVEHLATNQQFENTPLAVVNDGDTVLLGRDAPNVKSWGQGFIWQNGQSTKAISKRDPCSPDAQ